MQSAPIAKSCQYVACTGQCCDRSTSPGSRLLGRAHLRMGVLPARSTSSGRGPPGRNVDVVRDVGILRRVDPYPVSPENDRQGLQQCKARAADYGRAAHRQVQGGVSISLPGQRPARGGSSQEDGPVGDHCGDGPARGAGAAGQSSARRVVSGYWRILARFIRPLDDLETARCDAHGQRPRPSP